MLLKVFFDFFFFVLFVSATIKQPFCLHPLIPSACATSLTKPSFSEVHLHEGPLKASLAMRGPPSPDLWRCNCRARRRKLRWRFIDSASPQCCCLSRRQKWASAFTFSQSCTRAHTHTSHCGKIITPLILFCNQDKLKSIKHDLLDESLIALNAHTMLFTVGRNLLRDASTNGTLGFFQPTQ